MRNTLEKFVESSVDQMETVDSILQGKANMYAIRAKNIAFQVSELASPLPPPCCCEWLTSLHITAANPIVTGK